MKLIEESFSLGTVITHFLNKPCQEINFKSHLNSVLGIRNIRKNIVRLAYVPCDFVSLYLLVLT